MAAEATTETAGPKPATSKELREKFPKSSAEWREEQTDAGATLEEASIAYGQLMAERLEAAEQERDQAKAEAEQATADTGGGEGPPKSRRGAPSLKAKPADGETATGGEFDYRAMAEKYMADRKCRWSEACLAIKRRHPEARGAFGAPPKRGS